MKKKYWQMTAAELATATEQFDEPSIADTSRPLTAAENAQWGRAKRKRGRPRIGAGFRRISVSIEKGLLRRADELAKQRRVSRSKLFAQVLEEQFVKQN